MINDIHDLLEGLTFDEVKDLLFWLKKKGALVNAAISIQRFKTDIMPWLKKGHRVEDM